jgi:hypothetical protein
MIQTLPENILRRMSEADRKQLGKGFRTAAECEAVAVAKSEKQLQQDLYSLLHRRGHRPRMQRMDRKSNVAVGMPDISFEVGGRSCHWEVKLPGKHPTGDQIRTMAELAAEPNCAYVRVIRSYREGLEDLEKITKERKNK